MQGVGWLECDDSVLCSKESAGRKRATGGSLQVVVMVETLGSSKQLHQLPHYLRLDRARGLTTNRSVLAGTPLLANLYYTDLQFAILSSISFGMMRT